jgi:hypothetical protein
MGKPRWRQRPDSNQDEIVEALQQVGAKVLDLYRIGNLPDILVGYRQCFYLLEIKTEKGRLNASQRKFFSEWDGYKVYVVRSPIQALEAIGAVKNG